MRILLIEDHPMIGEAVPVTLKDAAYSVDRVTDGANTGSALERGEHQAGLLDAGGDNHRRNYGATAAGVDCDAGVEPCTEAHIGV